MQQEDILILGYWNIRGRSESIKALLEYLNVPYQLKNYPENDFNQWFGVDKPSLNTEFPNLPYLLDGNNVITESDTILQYVCQKGSRPDLIGLDGDTSKL